MCTGQAVSLPFSLSFSNSRQGCWFQTQPRLHSSREGGQSPNHQVWTNTLSFCGTKRTSVVQLSQEEVYDVVTERWKGISTLQLRHLPRGRPWFADNHIHLKNLGLSHGYEGKLFCCCYLGFSSLCSDGLLWGIIQQSQGFHKRVKHHFGKWFWWMKIYNLNFGNIKRVDSMIAERLSFSTHKKVS